MIVRRRPRRLSTHRLTRTRRTVAVVLALSLIAAACGDDADTDVTEDGTTTTTVDGSSTTTSAAPDTMPDEPEIVLTDSFRGVTAQTITLGYSSIDFELLNNSFNLDLAFVNNAPIADAIVAMYNERGGVLGRQIELIHESYLPVGPISADEVCVKLTEDVDVFAVLGGFAGPGAADVTECFPELHDTIVIGAAPRAEQAERAGGLWVSTDMSLDRRNEAIAKLMSDAGVLDELGSIMVIGSNEDEAGLVDVMAAALRDVGVDVPFTDFVTTTGDRFATANNVGIWIEQARNAGLSTIVLLGEGEFRNQEFFMQAPDFTYILGNGDAITDWQSIRPDGLQEGTRIITNNNGPDVGAFDNPDLVDCMNAVGEALDVEVLATSQLPEGEPNYFSGAVGVCRTVSLFVQIATAAGPDLTNDTWVAALDNLPDLDIPGYQFVSLSSDKVDARDQLVLVEYNLDTMTFDPISDPIDVG